MRITLLAFGMLRELLGNGAAPLELPAGATVEDVLERCRGLAPEKDGLWSSVAVAVNQEYVRAGHRLAEGDEVALLPPVSGGRGRRDRMCGLCMSGSWRTRFFPPLERPEDGAVTIFDGMVRNHSRGRTTLYLEYEAYEAMAVKKMEELAAEAMTRYPIRNVALVHRLGRLEVGEIERADCGVFGAPGGGVRCLPVADRHAEADGADMEEGVLRGWGGMGDGDAFPAELKPGEGGH